MNAEHFADALLRTLGGVEITLRVITAPGDDFGAAPTLADVRITPAIIHLNNRTTEALVAAHVLNDAAEREGMAGATALLNATTAVVGDGATHRIVSFTAELASGRPYLYRIALTK